jgi:large repetitive protein
MKKVILTISSIVIILASNLFAQLENTIWYFGNSTSGIKFNQVGLSFIPSALNDKQPLGQEGSGVAVNPITGALMFYSDGQNVYDASHNLMTNGSNLGGCNSAAQAVAMCPVPGQCNRYYLFSNGTGCPTTLGQVRASIIDMNTNQVLPLADWNIPITDNLLPIDAAENMILVPIQGTNDFWLTGKTRTTSNFYSFLIDENFNPQTAVPVTSDPAG